MPTRNPADMLQIAGIEMVSWRRIWLVAGLVIAIALPFLFEGFTVFQLTRALIYAIAILGLNLLTGFNGQFSLGHSAFFAIGAYTTAIMMDRWEVAYYWTILPAAAVCFVAGFLFGLPALRLEGLYLALATFALATATPQILKYEPVAKFTGGVQGLDVFPDDSPVSFLSNDQWWYYFTLVVALIAFLVAWNLVRGRTGRAMIAIRDNPIASKTMGINTALYKSLTFGVSAAFTGVAGALEAIVIQFVAPDSFTFLLAVSFLVGLVVGGIGSIPGAIFGGLFILLIPNWADQISQGLSWAIYGLFLIGAVYVMPAGAAGLVRLVTMRLAKKPSG